MKHYLIAVTIFLSAASTLISSENHRWHFMFGGRYDDLRMCVGSPAGVKGGPVGDIQWDIPIGETGSGTLILNLPVMRPILFGTAFKMLQFEPQVSLEQKNGEIVRGPGLGISLHYGPDYNSDLSTRGEDFFAAGPYFSYLYARETGKYRLGLRAFSSLLFSSPHAPGKVLGLSLEYGR